MDLEPKIKPYEQFITLSFSNSSFKFEENRKFYRDTLECIEGRSSDHWVDFNFFGHQLVIHFDEKEKNVNSNPVDGKSVPIPHFGVVLDWNVFHSFAKKIKIKIFIL